MRRYFKFRYYEIYRNMDSSDAVDALSALAQEHRLRVFRLLVRAGPQGLPAGEIARQIGIPPSTMSSHLGIMVHADIIECERESRSIIYRVNTQGVQRLLEFLVADCCAGQAELCAPITVTAKKALACCDEDDSRRSKAKNRKSR